MSLAKSLEHAATLPREERDELLEKIGQIEYDKCAADPFYWFDPRRHDGIAYVKTVDRGSKFHCNLCKDQEQRDSAKLALHLQTYHGIKVKNDYEALGYFTKLPPLRAFPFVEKEEYLRPLIETWLGERYFCIEKSRDMMATWLVLCLYVWDTYFHAGRENIFQSEKAPKALELINRANQIYSNQPKFLRQIHPGRMTKGNDKSGILEFTSLDSKLLGFAQGADQIRMYHPSGLFQDEAAYQIGAEEGFIAVKPALQSGGRYTAVSSANPSFFMTLCRDETDAE
jgi:hypothetical protein